MPGSPHRPCKRRPGAALRAAADRCRPIGRRRLAAAAVGCLALATGTVGASGNEESQMVDPATAERMLFDFAPGAEPWPSIDDPVMGGRSQSRMRIADGRAVFAGVVSLENNGGFASLRSPPAEHDLRDFDGVALRVLGDGKIYGVRLRTTAAFDGASYQAKLETEAGAWAEVRLPFSAFVPVFRGRRVPGHPALDPGAVKSFGLIISDRQEGPFRLEIEWIKAYR